MIFWALCCKVIPLLSCKPIWKFPREISESQLCSGCQPPTSHHWTLLRHGKAELLVECWALWASRSEPGTTIRCICTHTHTHMFYSSHSLYTCASWILMRIRAQVYTSLHIELGTVYIIEHCAAKSSSCHHMQTQQRIRKFSREISESQLCNGYQPPTSHHRTLQHGKAELWTSLHNALKLVWCAWKLCWSFCSKGMQDMHGIQ